MELAELPVGLESESPQFRPCQTAHGLQGIGMRQYERIAGRISGTDIGFLAFPTSPAHLFRIAQNRRAATMAVQPASRFRQGALCAFVFLHYQILLGQYFSSDARFPLPGNRKSRGAAKKDSTESSAGIVVSHPAIDSVLYFSNLSATYC